MHDLYLYPIYTNFSQSVGDSFPGPKVDHLGISSQFQTNQTINIFVHTYIV